jgi:hypothetical protein
LPYFDDIFTWPFLTTYFVDEVQEFPVKIPVVKPDTKKANPRLGVGTMAFSCDCRYMFTKNGKLGEDFK